MALNSRHKAVITDTSGSGHVRLKPVPLTSVKLTDEFWAPKRKVLREVTLPDQYNKCEDTGRIDNFRRAAGKIEQDFQGRFYNDSDVYKWLEAVSWMLAECSDPKLEHMANTVIHEIEAAQEESGYINTYLSVDRVDERWTHLESLHELYCGGHLIQAGIAHYRATGSERLLNVGRRFADYVCDMFGPEEEGKREGGGGHEEIKIALAELFRVTGEGKYLRQAQYFLDMRGKGIINGKKYLQDHVPFRELENIAGHAVRAVYLNMGATDIYSETGEQEVLDALERLWDNMSQKRMYLTGGIGARYSGESFGKDYDLPNEKAYAETCAAIANVMWNWRMLQLDGDAKYTDAMEVALYNGALVGLSLEGDEYFYVNPLEDNNTKRRKEWFGCACCPPNIARMLAEIPGQVYSSSDEGIWAHFYADSTAAIEFEGRSIAITQDTNYPWDGSVEFTVDGEGEFSLYLRIPEWCDSPALEACGESIEDLVPGSYAEVRREWKAGDTVTLELPMPVKRMESHPRVAENRNKQALMCGPIVYCLESVDNPDIDLRDVVLYPLEGFKADYGPVETRDLYVAVGEGGGFEAEYEPDLLGGVNVVRGTAGLLEMGWLGKKLRKFYRPSQLGSRVKSLGITAIPYYAWANREPGQMITWIPTS